LSGLPEFGDEWFPARCKMVLSLRVPPHSINEQGIMVTVDPAYPNAWRREPYYVQILARARQVRVEIGRSAAHHARRARFRDTGTFATAPITTRRDHHVTHHPRRRAGEPHRPQPSSTSAIASRSDQQQTQVYILGRTLLQNLRGNTGNTTPAMRTAILASMAVRSAAVMINPEFKYTPEPACSPFRIIAAVAIQGPPFSFQSAHFETIGVKCSAACAEERPTIPIKTTRLDGIAMKPSSFERTTNTGERGY
jgi:hypothetical protein